MLKTTNCWTIECKELKKMKPEAEKIVREMCSELSNDPATSKGQSWPDCIRTIKSERDSLAKALVAMMKAADLVSQKYNLIQPFFAVIKKHAEAFYVAEKRITDSKSKLSHNQWQECKSGDLKPGEIYFVSLCVICPSFDETESETETDFLNEISNTLKNASYNVQPDSIERENNNE